MTTRTLRRRVERLEDARGSDEFDRMSDDELRAYVVKNWHILAAGAAAGDLSDDIIAMVEQYLRDVEAISE